MKIIKVDWHSRWNWLINSLYIEKVRNNWLNHWNKYIRNKIIKVN